MSFKHLKYYPELNKLTGSINATLVLLQLEYWFAKCKGDKFYKFLEGCEHALYRQGDSWVEELGFTKHEFRTAFAKIGKAYKSKKTFMESQDVFEGKCFASYYDRIKGLTYYIRNNQVVDQLLRDSLGKNESLEAKKDVEIHQENSEELQRFQEGYAKDNGDLGKKQIKHCVNKENESPLSVDYNKRLLSVKDTHTTKGVPYETIKELFNKCCTSFPKVTVLTQERKTILQKLWDSMGQAVESFKKVFLLAEESDFLSGRKGSWRASFDWLMKEEKFVAVLEGTYANREPQPKLTAMYSHNWDFEELEKLEAQYIDKQVSRFQREAAVI